MSSVHAIFGSIGGMAGTRSLSAASARCTAVGIFFTAFFAAFFTIVFAAVFFACFFTCFFTCFVGSFLLPMSLSVFCFSPSGDQPDLRCRDAPLQVDLHTAQADAQVQHR